ncbi:phospholipid-transporting ATPase ABCA1-like [Penaeus chinensis]|uniref:phospholipid-transporting ATPase ABCA1-like n=1 Tax=Penaeus chinensis TaxID=139456 RepID=UPI001FB6AFB0|nr:phospholipid-transporting ATPase ABCA1-like [Penaeus chinensis]XP_047471050.1 phospholipid-transporting ATPase ABCA1-like [Penaeus chinensis]
MESPKPSGAFGSGERRQRSAWRHLLLLLWKSLLLRRRHWLLTLLEVILPVGLFSVMLFIRLIPGSTFSTYHFNQTIESPAEELSLRQRLCWNYGIWSGSKCHVDSTRAPTIYYGPDTPFTQDMAKYIAQELGILEQNIRATASNDEIDKLVVMSYYARNVSYSPSPYNVGLFFFNLEDLESSDPPQNLDYDLRLPGWWSTMWIYDFLQLPGPGISNEVYLSEGFTLIQSLVDRRYISLISNDSSYIDNYKIETQEYPYPAYESDFGLSFLYSTVVPSFLVTALVLLSPSLIKSVVHEKETGVRELVCLMGINRWLVWLGWFLHSALLNVVVISVLTVMLSVSMYNGNLYVPPILAHTDTGYVWLLLFLYSLSSIAFCLAISTFFNRPTLAMTVGILVWLLSYSIPNNLMYYKYDTLGQAPKVLSCLLPNMAITWAFKVIQMFEGRGKGVVWSTIWEPGNPRDQLNPAIILIMLAFDTFLYLLITWYVDQVNPGTYGVPQPWYFPFQKNYWCGSRLTNHSGSSEEPVLGENQQYFEKEPAGLKPGIIIKNLRKEFKELGRKTKVAVENVSLTCSEGQCTVLLGHNGAGKTTTMSVLTGVYAATSGYAEVNGWNIATNLSEAREELGLCPQHNMLFVDLTVLQHLLFFGRLKGLTRKSAKAEALEILTRLELLDKQHMFGSQLSGGMKRKLSLAISLMGSTKVVILDEPSSGLDPESRRWVWDVVQGERGRRTFLITTHHMEEADVLGDRVAIMASGRVVCAGSTLFLKKKFGDGYILTIMVNNETVVEAIKRKVEEHLPSATLANVHSGELTFKLPPDTEKFAGMLDALSAQKETLGLRHISLSLTNMERVFLRVGEMLDDGSGTTGSSVDGGTNGLTMAEGSEHTNGRDCSFMKSTTDLESAYASSTHQLYRAEENNRSLKGKMLAFHRLKAFLIKRLIYSKRKWVLLITQSLIPVLVSIICLVVDKNIQTLSGSEPPLQLDLGLISPSTSFVHAGENQQPLMDHYMSLFSSPHKVIKTTNMTTSLLEAAHENIVYYRENSICSAEFLDLPNYPENYTLLNMLYQSVPHHVLGISTLLVDNALLRLATNSTDHDITTTNRPLPKDTTWQFRTDYSTSALVYSSVMPLALCFLSASFLVFPLQERETKAKQVQIMTGAPVWALWASSFVWDFLAYMVTALLIFIFFVAINPSNFFLAPQAAGVLFFLLMMYGWGSIPLSYVFSFLFKTAASGFAILTLINIVAGQMLSLVVYVLGMTGVSGAETAGDVLHWISSIIPTYPVSVAFRHLVQTSVKNSFCDTFDANITAQLCAILAITDRKNDFVQCCPGVCGRNNTTPCFEWQSYFRFTENGMGPDLLTLFVNGLIFFCAIALIEAGIGRVFLRCWRECTGKAGMLRRARIPQQERHQDEDVVAEEELVKRMVAQGNAVSVDVAMLVSELSKQFFGSLIPAVNKVSFTLGRGECLGLLGVNGAGKTTTFRMLTGDEEPSGGNAFIDRISLMHQRNKFVQNVGYCPQFDAIMGELTGKEMLWLMGRLRGVNDITLRSEVEELVALVDLTECASRPSSTYSGGNRRKLSTAMALVGAPSLIFLDEPTTGVDPASRRRVWTAVSRAVSNGQSVVLTSHSMEECEALCSRIIMMSKGAVRCVGTTGHLKAKFGQGYSLQVKLKTHDLSQAGDDENERIYQSRLSELKDTVRSYFPGATVSDEHKGMLAYLIPRNISWAVLFSVMEDLKAGRKPGSEHQSQPQSTDTASMPPFVEDYAASDTSLEQVFLSFAREANSGEAAVVNLQTRTGNLSEQSSNRLSQGVAGGSELLPTPGNVNSPAQTFQESSSSIANEQQVQMVTVNNSGDLLTEL